MYIAPDEVPKLHKLLTLIRRPRQGRPMSPEVYGRALELGFIDRVPTKGGHLKWILTPAGEAWAAPYDLPEPLPPKTDMALKCLEHVKRGINAFHAVPGIAQYTLDMGLVTCDYAQKTWSLTPRGEEYLAAYGPYVPPPPGPPVALPPTSWGQVYGGAASPPPRPVAPPPAAPTPPPADANPDAPLPGETIAERRVRLPSKWQAEKAAKAPADEDDDDDAPEDREVVTPPGAFSWASQKSTTRPSEGPSEGPSKGPSEGT